jgi:hypothetical protein
MKYDVNEFLFMMLEFLTRTIHQFIEMLAMKVIKMGCGVDVDLKKTAIFTVWIFQN